MADKEETPKKELTDLEKLGKSIESAGNSIFWGLLIAALISLGSGRGNDALISISSDIDTIADTYQEELEFMKTQNKETANE